MVVLDHGRHSVSVYAHAGELQVAKGRWLEAGDPLGVVGEASAFAEPSLFFEVTDQGRPVDPLSWLRRKAGRKSSRRGT